MAKKKPAKLREDVAETARRVFLESIGEAPKTLPPSERTEKNPEAVRRGRAGGKKGGKARAASLTPEKRQQIARSAASARHGNNSAPNGIKNPSTGDVMTPPDKAPKQP